MMEGTCPGLTLPQGTPPTDPCNTAMGVSKTWGRLLAHWGRLLAHLWLVGAGSVVFASLRLAFACSGTVRHVTPAPVVRHQPAPGF